MLGADSILNIFKGELIIFAFLLFISYILFCDQWSHHLIEILPGDFPLLLQAVTDRSNFTFLMF